MKKSSILYFFIALFCFHSFIWGNLSHLSNDLQISLNKLASYSGPKTYLLSYPRSGNTWLRYCIEVLTLTPTFSHLNMGHVTAMPLGFTLGHPIRLSRPPIVKVHMRSHMNIKKPYDHKNEKLILLIRNPKEALFRQLQRVPVYNDLFPFDPSSRGGNQYNGYIYFDNITIFDEWNPEKKLVVYYEDLILNPHEELARVLIFLGCDTHYLEDFIENIDLHKQKSLDIYSRSGGSVSKGKDVLYHSRRLTPEQRNEVDVYMSTLYPDAYARYIHGRYSEQYLESIHAYDM